jgi:hypothetical protein
MKQSQDGNDSPLARFLRGMTLDLDQWRDGIGHDVAALAEASPGERRTIEKVLLSKRPRTWREIEALAALDTPAAEQALREALDNAVQWITYYAIQATSGGEGVALSAERDRFLRGLGVEPR